MTTHDENSPDAAREKPDTIAQRVRDELSAIGQDLKVTKAFGRLSQLAIKAVPYDEAALEVMQVLKERENSEQQRRLQDYVMGVAQDHQYDPCPELRDQDVIPVMRKLAADDETGKTEYYTRLTVGLGRTPLSQMPKDLGYHFIRLVSSLTCYQIEFARKLKVLMTVPMRDIASIEEAELAFIGQDNGMAMQAVSGRLLAFCPDAHHAVV